MRLKRFCSNIQMDNEKTGGIMGRIGGRGLRGGGWLRGEVGIESGCKRWLRVSWVREKGMYI